ncbi:MAG TPA: phosphoglycerate kinase, partial [Rhodoblastus sp.]|nr:phosphoglycerate kinase [Rhodoblastus sp.]
MAAFRTLDQLQPKGKRVLVRVDLNVPMENGKVTDATRIDRILPTIREIADKGGKVILLAHFGRPKNGPDEANSLKPIAKVLGEHLKRPVAFAADCIGEIAEKAVAAMKDGDVLLLQNTRFHKGEEKNDPLVVAGLAALGDAYVNDAFSAAHRAHASTEGLAHKLPAYAGRTMQAELEALDAALGNPKKPVAAIVGGAKVSTKLDLLGNLVKKVDILIIGGGMANTFLAARGVKVGKSLCEHDLAATAREIEEKAKAAGCEIVLPVDGLFAKEFKAHAEHRIDDVAHIHDDEMMLDVGPKTVAHVEAKLAGAKTLVWNGPFGAFEIAPFDTGTVAVAHKAAALTKA